MKLIKARQHLVVRHNLVVEINGISFLHLYRDIILYLAWRRRHGGRQIDANTLHVGLAQAHHHKAGEQKEHDVDQGNDLDTGSFVRNW